MAKSDGLWLWDEGAQPRLLFGSDNGDRVTDLQWSPDGARIAVVTTPVGDKYDIVSIYDLETDKLFEIKRGTNAPSTQKYLLIGWPDNNRLLFYHGYQHSYMLWSYDDQAGTSTKVFEAIDKPIESVRDGRWATAQVPQNEDYALLLLDLVDNMTYPLAVGKVGAGIFLLNGNVATLVDSRWREFTATGSRPIPVGIWDQPY